LTSLALAIVLIAAVVHAFWNLLAKRAGGGAVFVWLYAVCSTIIWTPLTLSSFLRVRHSLTLVDLTFLVGSGLIHTAYFVVLQKAYRVGDLSFVYPLARGTGPALSALGAIVLLGERPTTVALAGTALVVFAIVVFFKPGGLSVGRQHAVVLGLTTGVLIASYTLWDKHAVTARHIPPILMEWATGATRVILLLPIALRNWSEVRIDWKTRRWFAIWIGVLNPLAYLLILFAMTFTPVSYIAPSREISILFGAFLGGHFLGEGDCPRRLAGAGIMVLGILCLSVA
jgi:drug/metabolite transporter (DMT)-like permease